VAFASGKQVAQIEASYRRCCDAQGAYFFQDECIDEDEGNQEEKPQQGNDCEELLSCMARETCWIDPEADLPDLEVTKDLEMEKMPDREDLKQLLEQPDLISKPDKAVSPKGDESGEHMPMNLEEALELPGDTFNALFRLAVRLRSARGGCDTLWVNKGRSIRRASRRLNWHQ